MRQILWALCGALVASAVVASAPIAVGENDDYDAYLRHLQSVEEPLTDEEEALLEELYQQGLVQPDQYGNLEYIDPTDTREIELEMEPALPEEMPISNKEEEPEEEPQPKDKESKSEKMARRGQAEYETWIDPAYSAAAMHAKKPTVDIKRTAHDELHFDDGNSFRGNAIFVGVVGVCAVVAMIGTLIAGVAYYKLHKQHELSKDNIAKERRAVQGSVRGAMSRGDQKNAYSAQLHHYQQTKNEIIRMEQSGAGSAAAESEESDVEGDEADYSVYECPGLAPTGDIEVANPMFDASKQDK